MKLEVGKRYITRTGRTTGELWVNGSATFPFRGRIGSKELIWTLEGRRSLSNHMDGDDLVAEYHEPAPSLMDTISAGQNERAAKNREMIKRMLDGQPPYTEAELQGEEDILHEAFRLTGGDRQQDYGSPAENFTVIAKMWSALKGVEFSARDVAMFQICVKLSREAHHSKRDNSTDIAGYARCLHLCNEAASQPSSLQQSE